MSITIKPRTQSIRHLGNTRVICGLPSETNKSDKLIKTNIPQELFWRIFAATPLAYAQLNKETAFLAALCLDLNDCDPIDRCAFTSSSLVPTFTPNFRHLGIHRRGEENMFAEALESLTLEDRLRLKGTELKGISRLSPRKLKAYLERFRTSINKGEIRTLTVTDTKVVVETSGGGTIEIFRRWHETLTGSLKKV